MRPQPGHQAIRTRAWRAHFRATPLDHGCMSLSCRASAYGHPGARLCRRTQSCRRRVNTTERSRMRHQLTCMAPPAPQADATGPEPHLRAQSRSASTTPHPATHRWLVSNGNIKAAARSRRHRAQMVSEDSPPHCPTPPGSTDSAPMFAEVGQTRPRIDPTSAQSWSCLIRANGGQH